MPTVDKRAGQLGLTARVGRRIPCIVNISRNLTGYAIAASAFSLVDRSALGTIAVSFIGYANGKTAVSLEVPAMLSAAIGPGTFGWSMTATAPTPIGSASEDILSGILEIEP